LDLEWARDRRLESPTRSAGPRVIRSSHLGEGTPSDTVVQLLESGAPADGILKVVVSATLTVAIQHLLPLAERDTTPRAVLLTTGPSGSLFRAWARRLRLPWVYASLPEQPGRPYALPVEPTQIPVDRLQPYLAVEDAPMFALLGHPVAHSRSPAIHHRWMARQGRVGLYTVLDVGSAEEFQLALQELPRRGVRGVNVTHPWKGLAFRCTAQKSPDALEAGTANTLTFQNDGISADNTDLGAIKRRLGELHESGIWDGDRVTVLGAGGAARATLAAVRRLGAHATVCARRDEAATSLAEQFGAEVGDADHPVPASLVVHATSVGRTDSGPLEVPLRPLVTDRSYVLDWVYAAGSRSVSDTARQAGARYEDGTRLLVYQAVESYRAWWGEAPDPESVEVALAEVACTE
ncbi:MAG: type I 3-dehydroquinate dehydratase, partial [Thermoplasmata archaeon]|nr:type I 3-dehydroquinate dehydratase [Thermoplasmata archaeon]